MKFEKYHISETIKKNLALMGFKRPTNIQFKSIPSILKGEDVNFVAQANGIDANEKWGDGRIAKGKTPLNPGMVRMNLGNVLRGRVKRGEYVIVGIVEYNKEAKAA